MALEVALLASLQAAYANAPWLVSLLVLLQLPGWVVARGVANAPMDAFFTSVVALVNTAVIYIALRSANSNPLRTSGTLKALGRPCANAGPVLLLAALVPMYMAIAIWTPGRVLHTPELFIDRLIPVSAPWVLVYGSQWVFSFLPAFVVRGVLLRRRAVLAYLTIVIVSYVGFLIYPTFAPRPASLEGDDVFARSLRVVYGFDPPYNCFPSLHVAYSFLAALIAHRVHRGLGFAALGWATLIAASTLFTKQHYFLDVVSGALVAFAAYAVFLRKVPEASVADDDRAAAPFRALAVPAIYGVVIAAWSP